MMGYMLCCATAMRKMRRVDISDVRIPVILPKYLIVPQNHHNTVITVPALVIWLVTAPNLIIKIQASVNPGPLTLLA